MLELSGEDTLTVHVRHLLDLERTLEARGVWRELEQSFHYDLHW